MVVILTWVAAMVALGLLLRFAWTRDSADSADDWEPNVNDWMLWD